jgi:NadR type nicotinamide-nucleotide adenylyltransferase
LIRIAVTGPESTGKSFLSQQLAKRYNTVFVPEMARDYLDSLSRAYNEEDLLEIARLQTRKQEILEIKAKNIIFSDTDLLVIKIWSSHKYGRCHPWILEQLEKKPHDFYLLCNIDLPWEYDPQREHPHMREFFLQWYVRELNEYQIPWAMVQGDGENRVQAAVDAVNGFLNKD